MVSFPLDGAGGEKALKSSYFVYDASGKLLGSATQVEMAAIDLPITSINLGVKKVSGNPVLLDDYKLYPTKVATDFYLYTAKLGMPVADQTKAVGENTAYRLSWMNTTNDEKSYSVVATYYNGETKVSEEVVKELKLAPNTEGVETGIVELGDKGSAVTVCLRENLSQDCKDTGLNTTTLIVIISASVVVLAGIVVAVVLISKKKSAKATQAPAEQNQEDSE